MNDPASTHEKCWACGDNPRGLNLRFKPNADGVEADFHCEETFSGYPGTLQGGVIASILDSAMTHCLFERGKTSVTAELKVRYRKPVLTGTLCSVKARLVEEYDELSILSGELIQNGEVKARATGKFLPKKESGRPN